MIQKLHSGWSAAFSVEDDHVDTNMFGAKNGLAIDDGKPKYMAGRITAPYGQPDLHSS